MWTGGRFHKLYGQGPPPPLHQVYGGSFPDRLLFFWGGAPQSLSFLSFLFLLFFFLVSKTCCFPGRLLGFTDAASSRGEGWRWLERSGPRYALDDEDRAYITRRVSKLVHPGPGASEAMMVTNRSYQRSEAMQSEGAKQMLFQQLDRVVCRLEGERKWASGVVQRPEESASQEANAPPYVHVLVDPPICRLIAVPEEYCHLQRAAACNEPS